MTRAARRWLLLLAAGMRRHDGRWFVPYEGWKRLPFWVHVEIRWSTWPNGYAVEVHP